ncbi:MAG: DNA-3-methyladenine glycosylase [Chloroflexi bacterium]|nr:DNA-3-methyladenine glycosylase [Chloroflexota bacterium]
MPRRLPRRFYDRPTLEVARDLLGARLVRIQDGRRIAGIIVETEAYCGEEDLGCHAKAGRTRRTEPLYGPPGYAYVYFTYGNHWLLCPVTRPAGQPEAVLIRAILPTEGLDAIEARRGRQPRPHWTDGPGKLAQALGIDGRLNTADLTAANSELFIESGRPVPDRFVTTTARIGLYTVPEPWKSLPWRFVAALPGDLTQLEEDA